MQRQTRTSRKEQSRRWLTVLIGATAFIVALGVHLSITLELDQRRAFEQINVIFEADAVWYLGGFTWGSSEGSPFGGRSLVHPNVNNLVNPPVRLGAKFLSLALDHDEQAARRTLALGVAPFFAAISALLCFLTARTLGIRQHWSLAYAALCTASFSTIVYGSVPESYALAGTGFAALCYLLARTLVAGFRPNPLVWVLCGTFVTGVTVTNLIPFAIAAVVALYVKTGDVRAAIGRSVAWSAGAAVMTAVVCLGLSFAYGELAALFEPAGQAKDVTLRHATRLVNFPIVMTQSVLPPMPRIIDIISVIKEPWGIQFSLEGQVSWWRSGVVFASLIVAGYVILDLPRPFRVLYVAAGSMIGFNWALHSFFGDELLLYSQHWLMPLLLLLTPLLLPQSRVGAPGRAGFLILLGLVIWNDFRVYDFIFAYLSVT